MKSYTFLSEEILSLTAGRLAILKNKQGVSSSFMEAYVKGINNYVEPKNNEVKFRIDMKILENTEILWGKAYYYNKKQALFYAKKEMLYKVLEHIERAEYRVIDSLYDIRKLQNRKELWQTHSTIGKALFTTFVDTAKKYDLKI